jgi:hypothetical protein
MQHAGAIARRYEYLKHARPDDDRQADDEHDGTGR